MAKVKVHLPISFEGRVGELLETYYDMDFLPMLGDHIYACKKDKDSGLSFEIRRRYWDEDGKSVLELHRYFIDPPDAVVKNITESRLYRVWWTERDGDLVETLLANGWWRYGEDE